MDNKVVPVDAKSDLDTVKNAEQFANNQSNKWDCPLCENTYASKHPYQVHLYDHIDRICKKTYKCPICLKTIKEKCARGALNRHLQLHSNVEPYQCQTCLKRFKILKYLKRHMITHSQTTHFKSCKLCQTPFKTKCGYDRHMDKHRNEAEGKFFKCETCGKKFSTELACRIHCKRHNDDIEKLRIHKCHICSQAFRMPYQLRTHLYFHAGVKPFKCKLCGKCFVVKERLKNHMRIHTKERPFECEICHKWFKQQSALRVHRFVHTREKPYQCQLCLKRFSQGRSLNVHLLIHTEEKPHQCEICLRRFTQKNSLKGHMVTHMEVKPHECVVCSKTFSQKNTLAKHLLNHADEQTESQVDSV